MSIDEPLCLPDSPYIFEVDSRKAIPVRAVPFISSWEISPDVVARWLACRDEFYLLPDAQAFHIVNGRPTPIPAHRWDGVMEELSSLSAELKATELADGARYPEWRRRSPSFLMPVFIWLDDLEKAWPRFNGLIHLYGDGQGFTEDTRERHLDYLPFIDAEMQKVVLEGTSTQISHQSSVAIQPAPDARASESEENPASVPGKQPNTGAGKLAVEAAWGIECETKRAAIAKDVMKQLQSWADVGKEPATLIRSDQQRRGVCWRTEGGDEKLYDIEACRTTLKRWMKSRQ